MAYQYSKHALERITERKISQSAIDRILEKPEFETDEEGKKIFGGIVEENSKPYLIRVFVNVEQEPNVVITVYKTSKIEKYR